MGKGKQTESETLGNDLVTLGSQRYKDRITFYYKMYKCLKLVWDFLSLSCSEEK